MIPDDHTAGAFTWPELAEGDFGWNPDCRHFTGRVPCQFWRPCPGCPHYDPVGYRVLIVMLGRLGDMLIASPLPARIKRDHPDAHITWLVSKSCAPVARMNPDIDRVLVHDWEAAAALPSETFEAVYSFERTPSAAALVDRVPAAHKAGLAYGGPHAQLYPIGDAARHFFLMNTWNDYRTRRNTTTWTELYFAVAGYKYQGEPYVLRVPPGADARARAVLGDGTATSRICLNIGGSLPTKVWPYEHWLALGAELIQQGHHVVITGGPEDAPACLRLRDAMSARGGDAGRVCYTELSIEEFAAISAYCDVMVTGDTFGYHLALAHDRPVVLLLGPSNGAEVIPKHLTTITALRATLPCSPCARQVACGGAGGCMDTITPQEALAAVTSHLGLPQPSSSGPGGLV